MISPQHTLLATFIVVLVAWPSQTVTASCAMAPPSTSDPSSMQHLAASAPVVFVGTVLSSDHDGRLAHVRVDQVWNGPDVPQTVEVRGGPGTLLPNEHSDIDRTYAVGRRYLFVPTNASPPFEDDFCTATMPYTSTVARYTPTTARPLALPPDSRRPGAAYALAGLALIGSVALGASVAIWAVHRTQSQQRGGPL